MRPAGRAMVAGAVARAKQGDREAIRFLYLRFADNVYGYVRSVLRDEHDAEDVTQQVFARLITVIGKYEERVMPFSSWLLRVAHNVAIDHMRARRLVPRDHVRGMETPLDERGIECRRDLSAALEQLPAEQRDVIVLRHLAGLSPREIAQRMNRTEASVHGLHHRGRRALRAELVRLDAAPSVVAA